MLTHEKLASATGREADKLVSLHLKSMIMSQLTFSIVPPKLMAELEMLHDAVNVAVDALHARNVWHS